MTSCRSIQIRSISPAESFLFKLNECLSPTSILLVPLYSRFHMCACMNAVTVYFFYCNLHLKMMSCKRLSIDWLCYSTLYKISIFSKTSIFFFVFRSLLNFSHSTKPCWCLHVLISAANVVRSCIVGILCACCSRFSSIHVCETSYKNVYVQCICSYSSFASFLSINNLWHTFFSQNFQKHTLT